jgi:hypothetical protein
VVRLTAGYKPSPLADLGSGGAFDDDDAEGAGAGAGGGVAGISGSWEGIMASRDDDKGGDALAVLNVSVDDEPSWDGI